MVQPRISASVCRDAFAKIDDGDGALNRPGLPCSAGRGFFNICRGTLGSLAMFTAIRNGAAVANRTRL